VRVCGDEFGSPVTTNVVTHDQNSSPRTEVVARRGWHGYAILIALRPSGGAAPKSIPVKSNGSRFLGRV